VIMLTGQGSSSLAVEALRCGAEDYLEKGKIDTGALSRALRYASVRKKTEDALRRAHDELERRVEERTAELRQSNRQLEAEIAERRRVETTLREAKAAAEAGNRAKSRFLATMSHELRTPLNGVIGMTNLLLATELTAEQQEYARTARTSGEVLLGLIDDILDFSKIEAGKMDLDTAVFDVRQVVEEAFDLFREPAMAKHLGFAAEVDDHVPHRLGGDPGRLLQILVNLLGNAVKFTEQGSVRLHVCVAEDRGDSVDLRFRVEDTGVGIARETQDQLFKPFAQADASTTRRFGGTGLGLSIAQRLAAMMGGGIELTSELGRGSVFVVTVRLEKAGHAPAAESRPGEQVAPFIGATVLVVEDNAVNQRVAMRMLEKLGCRVDLAANGREAVEAVSRVRYGLVLMDCQMPVMDGFGATTEIRRLEPDVGHTPIVAMTANALKGDRERCLAAGMDDYVSKPVSQQDLSRILSQWLRDTRAERNG
jgi:signal transduction histidine kinase